MTVLAAEYKISAKTKKYIQNVTSSYCYIKNHNILIGIHVIKQIKGNLYYEQKS